MRLKIDKGIERVEGVGEEETVECEQVEGVSRYFF